MTDVDQILRAHAEAAGRIEPADDAWDHLVARLEDEPPGRVRRDAAGPRPSGRWALAAAAVVLAVVAASAAVAVVRTDGGGDRSEDEPRSAVGASSDPVGSPPPTEAASRPDVDPATMPDRIVAILDHDGDGLDDLVRVDGLGETVEVPAPGGTATAMRAPDITMMLPGSAVAPSTIDSVDVGPDDVAYVAVGDEVRAIGVADGVDRGRVADGRAPAVSGDGRRLATIDGDRIRVTDLATGETTWHEGSAVDEVTDLALSPDGRRLARQRVRRNAEGRVATTFVDTTSVDDADGWTSVDPEGGMAGPVFIDDDVLGVGLDTDHRSDGTPSVEPLMVGMADLDTGSVEASVGFPADTLDASPDGRWVFGLIPGVIRAFAAVDGWLWDSGTVVQLDGLVDAAW